MPAIAEYVIPRVLRQSTYSFSTISGRKSTVNGVEELVDGGNITVSSSAGASKVIKWNEVDLGGKEEINIMNTKFVASHNTNTKEEPTIYVPGQRLPPNYHY